MCWRPRRIDGVPVIVTELVSGGTLRDRVAREGPLAAADAVDAILQVIAGLQAAGDAGVLHRDVKPSNCFVGPDGHIKIGDFGIAIATRASDDTHVSVAHPVAGTIAFASPEQLRGDSLDVRADIYSVGATLYYLLTGREPFTAPNAQQLIARVLEQRPPRLRTDTRDVPRALERLVLRSLAKDRASRPPGYGELIRLLRPHSSEVLTPAPLGLRALAGLIDLLTLRLGSVLVGLVLLQWQQRIPASVLDWVVLAGINLLVLLVYFGVTESLWAASPGKAIVGLRVVSVASGPLRVAQCLIRASLWAIPPLAGILATVLYMPRALPGVATSAGLVGYVGGHAGNLAAIALFFATARRRNGFAGLHDLVSGTRVVCAPAVEGASSTSRRTDMRARPSSVGARVGPYRLLDEPALPGITVGLDEQLDRRVWIRRVGPGIASPPAARQSAYRQTRLRWLTGWRDAAGGWDAFEAPPGEPLHASSRRPVSWTTLRDWLRDLAEEVVASEQDGTAVVLATTRVWVTDQRAILVDCPPEPGAVVPAASSDASDQTLLVQDFLSQVARLGLTGSSRDGRGSADGPDLPLHAREFLDRLASRSFRSTLEILEGLQTLATRTTTVTRSRRAFHLALCAAPVALMLLVAGPLIVLVLPLLARSPEPFVLDACLRRLQQLAPQTTVAAADERQSLEVFVMGRFGSLLVDQSTARRPWYWPLIEIRRPLIDDLVRRRPISSETDTARAGDRLRPLIAAAERDRLLASRGLLGWRLLLLVVLLLFATGGAVGTMSALADRGGFLFRLLGIAIVSSSGAAGVARARPGQSRGRLVADGSCAARAHDG